MTNRVVNDLQFLGTLHNPYYNELGVLQLSLMLIKVNIFSFDCGSLQIIEQTAVVQTFTIPTLNSSSEGPRS